MSQNKDRNITSSQTDQSFWYKSRYSFQWITLLLCLSPLSMLLSLKNGQVLPYRLFGVLSIVFILLIIVLFFTVYRFNFNETMLSKENFIPFRLKKLAVEVRYTEINVIEYAPSIKGNTALIIHYVQEGNEKKIYMPMSKNKAYDIKYKLKDLGYNNIIFKI